MRVRYGVAYIIQKKKNKNEKRMIIDDSVDRGLSEISLVGEFDTLEILK